MCISPPFASVFGFEAACITEFFQQIICAGVIHSEQSLTLAIGDCALLLDVRNNAIFIGLWGLWGRESRRGFKPVTCPSANVFLVDQAYVDQATQFLTRQCRLYSVKTSIIPVVDVLVLTQIDEGQTLSIIERRCCKLVEPCDCIGVHQRMIAECDAK